MLKQVEEDPSAWLFICKKPGTTMMYASVDKNDTHHWTGNRWESVEVRPLYEELRDEAGVEDEDKI